MQVFNIASSGGRPFWILLPAFVILIVVLGVLVMVALSGGRSRFEVSADGVRLRGDLWGRFIPAASLRVDQARRIDFDTSPELTPGRRTMGTGLPGYQAGWFRLKNGDKALLYLTDRSKAIYIPTVDGFDLILSPDDPDGFMTALQRLRSSPQAR